LAQPFASHQFQYAAGSILPNVDQAVLDGETAAAYDTWKANHLEGGCGSGRYYVAARTWGANLTVSEAHGYGMIITVLMAGHDPDAQMIFDGMYSYFRDHPSDVSPDLMAWFQNTSCNDAEGVNSASDGDLDIAYALLLADKQWGSGGDVDYGAAAGRVLAAIKTHELHPSGYMLLGDWVGPGHDEHYDATRSSDFMPGHFASFADATSDGTWTSALDKTYDIFEDIQNSHSPSTGLLPDFIQTIADGPSPAYSGFLEGPGDGSYSANACRNPWRLAAHFLTTGDARAHDTVQKINSWVRSETGSNPWDIKAGYKLSGSPANGSDYLNPAYIAPLGVGAMVDAQNQAWLNELWAITSDYSSQGSYYEDTLSVLAMIAMSGNWWPPEAAACPGAD